MNTFRSSPRNEGKLDESAQAIHNDYQAVLPHLEQFVISLASLLQLAPGVHSIKSNCKDLADLETEIAHLHAGATGADLTIENYPLILKDVAVVKVFFVSKYAAQAIHEYICKTWNLGSIPQAVVPSGDPLELIPLMETIGCHIVKVDRGSAQIDYRIESNHFKRPLIAIIRLVSIIDDIWASLLPIGDIAHEHSESMEITLQFARRMIDNGMFAALAIQKINPQPPIPNAASSTTGVLHAQALKNTPPPALELEKTISADVMALKPQEYNVAIQARAEEHDHEIHIDDLAATISMAKTDITPELSTELTRKSLSGRRGLT